MEVDSDKPTPTPTNGNGTVHSEMETEIEQPIQPNQTIYVNNLNERIKKEELKKSLYAMFSQFGTVLDVVASKTLEGRGQAFICFKDIPSATNGLRAMQSFPFYDKPMRIQYAKKQSDIIAKLNGTFVPKKQGERRKEPEVKKQPKPKLEQTNKPVQKKPKTEQQQKKDGASNPKQQPPNKILFLENLPEGCTDLMIQMLFQQYPGYKEVRMVQGKSGIAFVEFENETEAGVAMNGLQHFKITPTNLMVVSYAKR